MAGVYLVVYFFIFCFCCNANCRAVDLSPEGVFKFTTINNSSINVAVVSDAKLHGEILWEKTAAASITLKIPSGCIRVVRVEDINLDGVLEVWCSAGDVDYSGGELYQLDVRAFDKLNAGAGGAAKKMLTFLSGDHDEFAYIRFLDIGAEGRLEMIVSSPTPTEGTPYQPGRVNWEDVYEFTPWLSIANRKYPDFYKKKYKEIEVEVSRLEKLIAEINAKKQNGKDEEELSLDILHVSEATEHIKIYKSWLRRIRQTQGEH